MRVLFLSYNGLLEPILPSQAIPYLKGLAKLGYEFTLLTYEKKKDLDRAGHTGVRELREELKKEGIEWHYLRYHKNPPLLSTLYDLALGAIWTFSIIISQRVKIVHVRGITPGIIMIALSKLLKVKILFDMRGLLAEEYVGGGMWSETSAQFRLVKKAERKLLTITDAVTVLTQKHLALNRSLDYMKHRDIPMDVVPCCVDMAKFDYRLGGAEDFKRELGIGGNFVLMYPGKIGTFYLVNEMIEFFKAMSEKVKNSIFLVITNDDASGFLRRARDAGIPDSRLMVIKAVPFEEMPKHLVLADAGIFFINPYKKIGSSPIKMGEFLASGVPVIINPGIGDTEEIVREGNVGVVVDRFTKDDYLRAVDKLLELISRGKALKERCRELAARRLSLDEAIAKYAGLYKALSIEDTGAEKK